ncbi:hypothetical protein SAMN05444580_10245 [Rhodococcus tukisamuensis]|uniref:Uncharacterized protein n=1 Tax=Rhodococcus tukisamuensis TaxID=168276 RepID=A0A1G6QFC1_9NOCA|nr:hypothetical protein SAMN05444580_10245 [Rhodococcus tukisamuensis]
MWPPADIPSYRATSLARSGSGAVRQSKCTTGPSWRNPGTTLSTNGALRRMWILTLTPIIDALLGQVTALLIR